MALSFVFLFLVSTLLLLYYVVLGALRRAKVARQMSWIPGPRTYPLLGSSHLIINRPPDGVFKVISQLSKQYGGIYKFWIGMEPAIIVTCPKIIQTILSQSQELKKSQDYGHIEAFIGDGLLISSGQKWHQRRKMLTPTLHYDILESFIPIMQKHALKFVRHIRPLAERQEEFDIVPLAKRLALDVLMDTAVGDNVNALEDPDSTYNHAIKTMGEIIFLRAFNPLYTINWLYEWSSYRRTQEKVRGITESFTLELIKKRESEREKLKTQDVPSDEFGKKKRLALLDLMLEMKHSGADLSYSDISEEVNTFLFAGHDTTSSALIFSLYLFGRHPKFQEDVVKEIDEHIPDIMTRVLKQQDMNKLELLDRCIKESLRMFPPAVLIAREFSSPFIINEKESIPAGVRVTLNMFALHRNPEYFSEPDTFNPDRFLIDNNDKRLVYSYIPFSAGPRNCIGQRYALYELKVLLSIILKQYEVKAFKNEKDIHLAPAIVLIPLKGLKLCFTPRVAT